MNIDIIGGALLIGMSIFILREFGWRGAPVIAAVGAVIILGVLAEPLGRIFGFVNGLGEHIQSDMVSAILKITAVGYLFGISADVCRSLGELQIAKSVEVVGRVEIFVIVLPFFEEIIKLGVSFL